MSIQKQSWTLPEPPVDTYSDELIKSAKEYSDVAVVVLSRKAGEGHNDIPMDVRKAAYDNNSDEYDDFPEGEHYLQLSQTERDMVDMVCSNFDNVIVVYNGANQFELGFADEYPQIKSVVWCPGTGNVGFNALGKVFSGEVNPSGKTPDTFIYDMTTAPWWNNAEKTEYTNLADLAVEGMNAGTAQVYAPAFTNYVEGIYVGYKYYETAAQEGAIDYDKTVQYPFGYGLSYTEFEQKMGELEEKDGQISVDVEVTNTGDVAGKDVVEVYYEPPYTNGGIEKSSANLIEFAKTDLLQPGESQTVTVTFSIEDMASYDENHAKAYVLEKGDYAISINSDSHTVLDQKTYTADKDVVYKGENKRASDDTAATNVFEDAKGDVTYLSRADHFANYEEATAAPASAELGEPYVSEYHLNSNFDKTTYLNDEDVMPTTGADNGLTLADMRDADYDDPRWEKLLDQPVKFIKSDMFSALNPEKQYNVIVSNPPYIPSQVIEGLEPEVKDHEPRMALDGEPDGLKFYRILAEEGKKYLKNGGSIYMEIGWDQAKDVTEIFEAMGFSGRRTVRDMAGNDRVVCARKEK